MTPQHIQVRRALLFITGGLLTLGLIPISTAQANSGMSVTQIVTLPEASTSIALSPDDTTIFATSGEGNLLTAIDVSTGDYLWASPLAAFPRKVVVASSGEIGYVALANKLIAVVDLSDGSVRDTFRVPGKPIDMALSENGQRLWLLHSRRSVSVIDPDDGSVLATMESGKFPQDLAINRSGSRAYVLGAWFTDTLQQYNGKKLQPRATIDVSKAPTSMALTPNGKTMVVSHDPPGPSGKLKYSLVDTKKGRVSETFSLRHSAEIMSFATTPLAVTNCTDRADAATCTASKLGRGQAMIMAGDFVDDEPSVAVLDFKTKKIVSKVQLPEMCDDSLFDLSDMALARTSTSAFVSVACDEGPDELAVIELPTQPAATTTRMWVAPDRTECTGVAPMMCLQVASSPNGPYTLFYDTIKGYTHQAGVATVLDVQVTDVANPPADGSSKAYTLLSIIDENPASTYTTCTDARAAGVTPIRQSDSPSRYAANKGLDRNNDGVACE